MARFFIDHPVFAMVIAIVIVIIVLSTLYGISTIFPNLFA